MENSEHANLGSTPKQSQEKQVTRPLPKRDLTFVTGSCLLKAIETKFLDQNVRVKSYQNAKIDDLQDSLSNMDLSRYQSIILHVGGHDVDNHIGLASIYGRALVPSRFDLSFVFASCSFCNYKLTICFYRFGTCNFKLTSC